MVYMQMIEFQAVIFYGFLCSFGPPSRALVSYHMDRGEMPLHDAVGVNCAKFSTTDTRSQVSGIQ